MQHKEEMKIEHKNMQHMKMEENRSSYIKDERLNNAGLSR